MAVLNDKSFHWVPEPCYLRFSSVEEAGLHQGQSSGDFYLECITNTK